MAIGEVGEFSSLSLGNNVNDPSDRARLFYAGTKQLATDGALKIDRDDANNGSLALGLSFGAAGSEGIASQRTAGGNQNGLDFYTNSAICLSITNAGNVGIGTQTPVEKLQVAGKIKATELEADGSVKAAAFLQADGSTLSGKVSKAGDTMTGPLTIQNALTVSGNVGIGITEPSSKLDVRGNVFVQAEVRADGGFLVDGQRVIDSDAGWHRSYGNTGWYNNTHGGGWYMADSTWIRSYGGKNLYHDTGVLRTDGTLQVGPDGNRLIVNTAGNVGINTTTPGSVLDVRGNVFVQAEVRADGGFLVDGQRVIDSDAGWHRSYGNTGWYNGTHGGGWYMADSTWIRSYGGKNIYHDTGILRTDGTFQVGPDGNRLIVNTSANVGIGTNDPKTKLQVVGDLTLGNDRPGQKFIFHPRTNGNGDFLHITFDDSAGNWDWGQGLILGRDGNFIVRGRLFVTELPLADRRNVQWDNVSKQFCYDNSSRKSKENITPLEDDFSKILGIEPKSYTRPAAPEHWEIGYIAEELHELGLSKLVYYDQAGLPEAINYPKVSMYLLEILKHHEQKIGEYERRIHQLEQQF